MRGIHQVHCLHLGEFNIFVWVFNINALSPLNFIYVLIFKVTIIDVICTMIEQVLLSDHLHHYRKGAESEDLTKLKTLGNRILLVQKAL